ncbi:MAG: hypothetical protein DSY77_12660 [Bacteroidetes bacterium]|nr:MAG: hypothetical protein DSY77_12660 [Bacteroidota bacterium]
MKTPSKGRVVNPLPRFGVFTKTYIMLVPLNLPAFKRWQVFLFQFLFSSYPEFFISLIYDGRQL